MAEMDKELLAERVRSALQNDNIAHRPMFGSIGFMMNGNLLCGAGKKGLMIRIDPVREAEILKSPHVSPVLMSQRRMRGYLRVGPDGLLTDEDLEHWVGLARDYARALPAKAKK